MSLKRAAIIAAVFVGLCLLVLFVIPRTAIGRKAAVALGLSPQGPGRSYLPGAGPAGTAGGAQDTGGTAPGGQGGAAGASAGGGAAAPGAATRPRPGFGGAAGPSSSSEAASSSGDHADPQQQARVMPYRPANYLHLSGGPPATSAQDDLQSPNYKRLLELAQPDARQQQQIADLWHTHEDSRRSLLPPGTPRAPNSPMMNPTLYAQIDLNFISGLYKNVLTPDQRKRVSAEFRPGIAVGGH